MRRKVIRQGKGTLTMSLPSNWVKQTGIKHGDELVVEQAGHILSVSPSLSRKNEKVSIDLKGLNKGLVRVLLHDLYVRGDDEITFIFENSSQLDGLIDVTRDLLGFQIISQSKKSCTIKELAKGDCDDFDSVLRRIFLLIIGIAEEGMENYRLNQSNAALPARDVMINTLTAYCLRILNKTGGKNVRDALHLHTLLILLEQLGDSYARLYHVPEISKSSVKIGEKIVGVLRDFYNLFYNFDSKKASDLIDDRDSIRQEIEKAVSHSASKHDLLALQHFRRIVDHIIDIQKFQLAMIIDSRKAFK